MLEPALDSGALMSASSAVRAFTADKKLSVMKNATPIPWSAARCRPEVRSPRVTGGFP